MLKIIPISLICLFCCLLKVKGQESYNGSFNSQNFRGTAIYNYKNDSESGERIFEGKFLFKTNSGNTTISGNYNKNFKDGLWQIDLKNVATTDVIMKYDITASVKGNYTNGKLNGKWVLDRTKIVSFSNSGISDYYKSQFQLVSYLFEGKQIDFSKSTKTTERSIANFNQNKFTGEFGYHINNGDTRISGKFDENGYLHGEWILDYYDLNIRKIQTRTYHHGVLQTVKIKDQSTGTINLTYDKDIEVREFFQNYDPFENYSKVGNNHLMLIEKKSSFTEGEFLEEAISMWMPNTDLSKSAYIFEVEHGSYKINYYPERVIAENNEKKREVEKLAYEKKKAEELRKKQEEEEEKARIQKRREFLSSDYGRLQEEVKKEVNTWLLKGTYETNDDYNKRLEKEGKTILNSITEKIVEKSKKQALRRIGSGLEPYDVETGSFNIIFRASYNKVDTISIEINREIAQQVYEKFKKDRYDHDSEIIIMPTTVSMIDNSWKITEALILFDAYFTPPGRTLGGEMKIFNRGKGRYQGEWVWTAYDKKYVEDFKSIKVAKSIDKGIYFFEWRYTNSHVKEQPLSFSFEELEIYFPE